MTPKGAGQKDFKDSISRTGYTSRQNTRLADLSEEFPGSLRFSGHCINWLSFAGKVGFLADPNLSPNSMRPFFLNPNLDKPDL
jgi:hypothetical protein